MAKKIIVMKFGGNTLADKDKILNAVKIIKSKYDDGFLPVIVVSANGNMTDVLLETACSLSADPDKRELDMLVSTGERISMALLSIALKDAGLPAISLTGSQIGLTTTSEHSGADIVGLNNKRLQSEIAKNNIPIIAGFQGIGEHKEITTLKRGGSDLSAVFLAKELKAECVEMIKDVEGVFDKDPKKDKNGKKLNEVCFDKMQEMCENGANVLHDQAVKLAKENNIPIKIIYYKTGQVGTIIK